LGNGLWSIGTVIRDDRGMVATPSTWLEQGFAEATVVE